jgi:hypothetical protein
MLLDIQRREAIVPTSRSGSTPPSNPPSKPSSKLSPEDWAEVSKAVGEQFQLEKSIKEQRAKLREQPQPETSLEGSSTVPPEAQPTDAYLKPEGRQAEMLCGGIRPAYGNDVLPGETEGQYRERKEREAKPSEMPLRPS